ncbi:hypothetical protein [Ichthyenterobacterium magnum]|uniref:Uncharacterized protein n=1 Tax=Ichthyenterobacterium magnum TaxID=1230530 RepID=A0A420DKI7_9FLAO|nr:hypothetical protein [Ichthyenterobacterium magnum]RKE94705.1 hypothetical protein BXY80_1716 [Ichthyenterobacterium magnum]
MKYFYFTFLCFSTLFVVGQSNIKKDIDDVYLDKLYIENDSTLTTEFQRYAINLFKNGGKLSDSIFKETKFHSVGVCLIHKRKEDVRQGLELTLYTLSYKDLRIKNYHKRFYYGKGREGLSNFFVGHDTTEQKAMIDEAVNAYLKGDSIPRHSYAYQFARTHHNEAVYYEKYFETDKLSTVVIGASYAYLRQNGNFIIQIEGFPDKALHDDTEELYVTDYFVDDLYAISVFIIDDSDNTAYKKIFKY